MVSIIACTIRDCMMENVFGNFSRQYLKDKELIVILNNNNMDIEQWRKKASYYDNVTIYQLSEEKTLGDCLNFGIEKARFDFVAKFDDDDYYSPYYLTEAMNVFEKHKDVQLVGKGVSFLYFEENSLLTLYKQGKENKAGDSFIKGGTLIFKKDLYPDIKFRSQKAGSDSEFRKECRRKKVNMHTTSRYNYVCVRRADLTTHTYQLPAHEYMKNCEVIQTIKDYRSIVTKKFDT